MLEYGVVFFVAVMASLAITPVVRGLAVMVGAVDLPDSRRIHQRTTPRLGGVAIFASVVLALGFTGLIDPQIGELLLSYGRQGIALSAAAAMVFILGAADDLRSLPPTLKISVEIAAAALVAVCGHSVNRIFGFDLGLAAVPISILWIVALTNAFNMMDGLDGLAAGLGSIMSATLLLVSIHSYNYRSPVVLAALFGSLLGFLRYNFNPASIFMGDSGSLFTGFVLASMSIETSNKQSTAVTLLVPMLALGLPVIELTLTTLRRLLREVRIVSNEPGRSRYGFLIKGRATLFAADKDHIHHRLLALGISHRNAVLLLYSACLVADAIALALVVRVGPNYLILLGAGAIAALAAIRRLDYSELQPLRNGMLLPLFSLRLLTQRGLQVACDLAFSGLSLLFALVLRAGWPLDDFHRIAFLHHAPVLAVVQIGALAMCGVYSRSYRSTGLSDLLILLRSLALASVGTWLVMQVTDFGSYPGVAVITLDLYFFASLAMLARFSFDLLDYQFQSNQGRKSRVLICGAQQAGRLVVKDILSNPALDMKIVGFLDDDSSTRNFCGFSVFHTEALNDLIAQRLFDEIVLTADKIPDKSLRALATRCRLADIRIRRFSVAWSEVDPSRLGEAASPERRLAEALRQLS